MMWNMDVSNPAAYVKAFSAFSKKIKKKYTEVGSNGIGQPIVGPPLTRIPEGQMALFWGCGVTPLWAALRSRV